MNQIPPNPTHSRGLLREEALQAFRDAVGQVIQEHKRLGMPLTVWRDGQVMKISPEEAETEYLAAKARAANDHLPSSLN